jgi:hypothetical protein
MNRIVSTLAKVTAGGALALATAGLTGCYDDAMIGDPAYYPSDGIVASDDPIYYDGYPTYYYGGYWYYRDVGGHWNYYRSEPGYLRSYRAAHPGVGRGRGYRGGGFRGARGGRGGGGHGGGRR